MDLRVSHPVRPVEGPSYIMMARLDTPRGRKIHKKRAASIEPGFAQQSDPSAPAEANPDQFSV